MNTRKLLLASLLATSLLATTALAGYTAGGTFVVKAGGLTLVDNGGVVCDGLTGSGLGGGCLPFPFPSPDGREGAFVRVHDDTAGPEVAFQVCIDNNGDGVCGGPQTDGPCRDQIFFSHDDKGNFFNPLGPLPPSSIPGCDNAFQGYVVLLCEGVHEAGGAPHTHSLSSGSIALAPFGAGFGDFCGGNGGGTPDGFVEAAAKAYRVV